jgi:hypothetical protein
MKTRKLLLATNLYLTTEWLYNFGWPLEALPAKYLAIPSLFCWKTNWSLLTYFKLYYMHNRSKVSLIQTFISFKNYISSAWNNFFVIKITLSWNSISLYQSFRTKNKNVSNCYIKVLNFINKDWPKA